MPESESLDQEKIEKRLFRPHISGPDVGRSPRSPPLPHRDLDKLTSNLGKNDEHELFCVRFIMTTLASTSRPRSPCSSLHLSGIRSASRHHHCKPASKTASNACSSPAPSELGVIARQTQSGGHRRSLLKAGPCVVRVWSY